MSQVADALLADSRAVSGRSRAERGPRHLYGSLTDFLCLGGASLGLMPLALLISNPSDLWVVWGAVVLMSLVNWPHFASSYQIFYRGFRTLAGPTNPDRDMRRRYLFAGIVAPALIAAALTASLVFKDPDLLGVCGNVMLFLVGWHYVKQGYGILMVDCTLKRTFFTDGEKRVLRINGYVVWLASWIMMSALLGHSVLWDIAFALPVFPAYVRWGVLIATAVSTIMTIRMLLGRRRAGLGVPVTGITAYAASLYLWQLFVWWNPVWLVIIPTLHSLQYLMVVWRFELNRAKDAPDATARMDNGLLAKAMPLHYQWRFAGFVMSSVVLGAALFWGVPLLLESMVHYREWLREGFVFLFSFSVFVNIHHYFVDNVIWRRQNPETRKYLFSQ